MPLKVLLMTEADVPMGIHIANEAFRGGLSELMFPYPPPAAQVKSFEERILKQFQEAKARSDSSSSSSSSTTTTATATATAETGEPASKPSLHEEYFLKVVDTGDKDAESDEGEMIAYGRWHVYPEGRTPEEVAADRRDAVPPPSASSTELQRKAAQDFFGTMGKAREEFMGTEPFYLLSVLVTHPSHHRRGAGALIMKWACDRADRAKMRAYLEASDPGRPLYEKFGFKAVQETIYQLKDYGGEEGVDRNTIMIREPVVA